MDNKKIIEKIKDLINFPDNKQHTIELIKQNEILRQENKTLEELLTKIKQERDRVIQERDRIIEDAHTRILYVEQDCNKTIQNAEIRVTAAENRVAELEKTITKIKEDYEFTIKDITSKLIGAQELRDKALTLLKGAKKNDEDILI